MWLSICKTRLDINVKAKIFQDLLYFGVSKLILFCVLTHAALPHVNIANFTQVSSHADELGYLCLHLHQVEEYQL